jgi:hypothetical protein
MKGQHNYCSNSRRIGTVSSLSRRIDQMGSPLVACADSWRLMPNKSALYALYAL